MDFDFSSSPNLSLYQKKSKSSWEAEFFLDETGSVIMYHKLKIFQIDEMIPVTGV